MSWWCGPFAFSRSPAQPYLRAWRPGCEVSDDLCTTGNTQQITVNQTILQWWGVLSNVINCVVVFSLCRRRIINVKQPFESNAGTRYTEWFTRHAHPNFLWYCSYKNNQVLNNCVVKEKKNRDEYVLYIILYTWFINMRTTIIVLNIMYSVIMLRPISNIFLLQKTYFVFCT